MNDYNQEFTDAWDRTLRFGLALPPIQLQVRKDCIDLAKALPVIVDCYNQHPSDKLRGRTAAIHNMLQPRLSEALGGLPIGWIELDGTPRLQHGEERIRLFLTEKWAAWQREV